MLLSLFSDPLNLIFYLGALVICVTIHEFAHAFVADHLGDPTPRLQGRVTLNPAAHFDPLGTLMILFGPIGWGKPVIFDPFNLRDPRRDSALISIAGPISNISLAIVVAIVRLIMLAVAPLSILPLVTFLEILIQLNVSLAVFNLIPIHPLDGFKIVGGFLPKNRAVEWYSLEKYGILFLIFLLIPIYGSVSPLTRLISPIIRIILRVLIPQISGII